MCAETIVAAGIGASVADNNFKPMTVIYVLAAIIMLLVVVLVLFVIVTLKKRKPVTGINNIPKSPCFDSPANEYTCLPTKDVSFAIFL